MLKVFVKRFEWIIYMILYFSTKEKFLVVYNNKKEKSWIKIYLKRFFFFFGDSFSVALDPVLELTL